MKKISKTACLLLGIALAGGNFAACGGTVVGPTIEEGKIQIYAFATDNGLGYQWMEKFAEDFNALPENSGYQVVPMHGTDDLLSTMDARLAAGTTEVNIYFGCQSQITTMIANNRFIDISDVYEMKVDGENGGTIREKTIDFATYKKAFSNLDGSGIYAVPYGYGVNGMLFDYKFFLDNDYLIYAELSEKSAIEAQGGSCEEKAVNGAQRLCAVSAFGNYDAGEVILSAGKDGKYGTYDDGQATTMSEFKTLLADIMDDNNYPMLYTTTYADAYLGSSYIAPFVQSMGYENYVNFMALNGDLKGKDGTVQASLTSETGAAAWDTQMVNDAYNNALTFFNEVIMGKIGTINGAAYADSRMIHPASYHTTSLTHTGAQDKFVTGFRPGQDQAAFLLEGVWWERTEAVNTLNGLEKYGTDEDPRGMGKREYRYYLYPTMDNQITDADKSIMVCQDDGCGVIFNNIPSSLKTQEEKDAFVQKCKEFLAFTLSNENLAYYTSNFGVPRPFEYTLSASEYANMTPFEKNVWDMLSDTDHITLVSPNINNNLNIIRSYAGLANYMTNKVQKGETDASYNSPWQAFKSVTTPLTVTEYLNGIKGNITEIYTRYYNQVKEYLND